MLIPLPPPPRAAALFHSCRYQFILGAIDHARVPEHMKLRFDGRSLPLHAGLDPSTSSFSRAPSSLPPCACSDFPLLGHWQQGAAAPALHWVYAACQPPAFVGDAGMCEGCSSSALHGKRILFAGASFAIRLLRHAFSTAGYSATHAMFVRHVTSNVTIDRFHVEWAEWHDARPSQSLSSISLGYTPIRGLFTRNWTSPSDHRLPAEADVIVADPGLHDVASNTLENFRQNIPAFFRALASVTRHVVLLLPTATHFDMRGVLAYHRSVPVRKRANARVAQTALTTPAASTASQLRASSSSTTSRLQPSPCSACVSLLSTAGASRTVFQFLLKPALRIIHIRLTSRRRGQHVQRRHSFLRCLHLDQFKTRNL